MTNVLIIGASGMAGHVISTFLIEEGFNVSTISNSNKYDKNTKLINISDFNKLNKYLDSVKFDYIINCAGILVSESESHKDLAVLVNSYFPHYLEKKYENTNTKIIHLSTDCVFSGKNGPYDEKSWPDGELFYDRTKALGEINNDKDLTFRMSIIGPDRKVSGIGLFNWFYKQSGQISGYSGSLWNGITTIELAKAIKAAIKQNISGVYNLVPKENISKYNLLVLFKEIFNRDDIKIKKIRGVSHNKTLINNRNDFKYLLPNYPEMIKNMKKWIEKHPAIYKHYEKK